MNHKNPSKKKNHFIIKNSLSSIQTVHSEFFIMMYNMLYTAQPVIAMAVFDQDVSAETSVRYPPLYEPGMRDMFFNRLKFAASAWQGLWTSFVLVAITLGISPLVPSTHSLPFP